jgi:hypothetical protein
MAKACGEVVAGLVASLHPGLLNVIGPRSIGPIPTAVFGLSTNLCLKIPGVS